MPSAGVGSRGQSRVTGDTSLCLWVVLKFVGSWRRLRRPRGRNQRHLVPPTDSLLRSSLLFPGGNRHRHRSPVLSEPCRLCPGATGTSSQAGPESASKSVSPPHAQELPRARLNSIIEGAIPTHEFSGVVMILRVMRTRCKGAVPARSRSPGNSGANTTPLDLLDGIACMDVVRFCKRLVFKALREVA